VASSSRRMPSSKSAWVDRVVVRSSVGALSRFKVPPPCHEARVDRIVRRRAASRLRRAPVAPPQNAFASAVEPRRIPAPPFRPAVRPVSARQQLLPAHLPADCTRSGDAHLCQRPADGGAAYRAGHALQLRCFHDTPPRGFAGRGSEGFSMISPTLSSERPAGSPLLSLAESRISGAVEPAAKVSSSSDGSPLEPSSASTMPGRAARPRVAG